MARFDSEHTVIETSYTRPDNTTQYAVNDALANSATAPVALTFSTCARNRGGSGKILGVTVIDSANQGTLPDLTLFIFDGAPTATNDNAEIGITDADAVNLICSFTLDGFAALDPTAGTNGNAQDQAAPGGAFSSAFRCGTTSRDLYGLVRVDNAYTPIAKEVFTFRLHIEQD